MDELSKTKELSACPAEVSSGTSLLWISCPGCEAPRSMLVWRSAVIGNVYKCCERSLNALAMTDTELRLMAAAASIGLSNMPKNG